MLPDIERERVHIAHYQAGLPAAFAQVQSLFQLAAGETAAALLKQLYGRAVAAGNHIGLIQQAQHRSLPGKLSGSQYHYGLGI